MKVVIVEDDFIVADHLRLMLEKHGVQVIDVTESYEAAMALIPQRPDLFFVDIRLSGEKTGIDLAHQLNKNNLRFIYLTANNEINTLKEAAKTSPLTYITKPYKEGDILALLEIYKSTQEKHISVKTTYGKTNLNISEILYFQSEGAYVQIVTHTKIYRERVNLTDYENSFPLDFVRVHRGYVVNKAKITQYNSEFVYINQVAIPVSRSYRKELKTLIE